MDDTVTWVDGIHAAFLAQVEARPGKTAFVGDDGTSVTYGELGHLVRSISRTLGARVGDTASPVLLVAGDGLRTVATALAASASGHVLAPMNPALGALQLITAARAIGAESVLHDEATADKARAIGEALAADDGVTCTLLALESLERDPDAEERAVRPNRPAGASIVDPAGAPGVDDGDRGERALLLTLSSGSTGDPKPVVFTDRGKCRRALDTAAEFDVIANDVVLCASPFFHSLGQRLTFMPLVLGATLVHLRRFSPRAWTSAVDAHGVTFTICVSSHLFALKERLTGADVPRSLRALVSSSAAIDRGTKRALFEQGAFDFHEMYGASEVATATRLDRDGARERIASVGRPCANVSVRVVDADGRAVAAGVAGEIQVASTLASPGYHARPDLTDAAWRDGWFRTGDHGYLDEAGYLHFVDRLSDVIVSGGGNVYPSDVETVLRESVDVEDCLVVGVADDYLGEAVVGVIRSGAVDTRSVERALRRHVRGRLAPVQQPLAYRFVEALPLNAAGKVDRKAVRAWCDGLGLDLGARFRALRGGGASR